MSELKKCSIYDVPYVSLEMLRRHEPCGGSECPASTDDAHRGFEPTLSDKLKEQIGHTDRCSARALTTCQCGALQRYLAGVSERRRAAMQKIVDLVIQLNCCCGEDAERTSEMQEALEEYFATDATR